MTKYGVAVLLAGAAVMPTVSRAESAYAGLFQKLPQAALDGLRRQDGSSDQGYMSPQLTNKSWSGSGNLGTIPQTNFDVYEYFNAPSSVPPNGIMTYLSWGYTASNRTNYPLYVYLCVGSTNYCYNVSTTSSGGYASTSGYNFPARSEVFFLAFAPATSTVELRPEIIIGSNYVNVGYSY